MICAPSFEQAPLPLIMILCFDFQPMNLVDFFAILPYVISFFLQSFEDLKILGKTGKIMRLVRVMRILRIFKLVRHFAGLKALLYTLKQVSRNKIAADIKYCQVDLR